MRLVPGGRTASRLSIIAVMLGCAVPHAGAQEAGVQQAPDPASGQAASRFDILAFRIKGNTLLPADAVERAVYPFTGPAKSEADVEKARAALQKAFEAAGYVAVSVVIPEQAVAGGVLLLEVQPQLVGKVEIAGDTGHAERVRAQAASLAPGDTLNLPRFQRDVIAMNAKSTRRVTPELKAGVAPGTLDVVLTVEESAPFHASAELNNFSSAATSALRASATVRHDDMWGRGDSLSLSVQTAPRRTDDALVFSGNYLLRLGAGTQLMLYGVHSDSDIAVVGGTSVIGKGDVAGMRLIRSLGSAEGFYHSLTVGFDWKKFREDLRLGADRTATPIEYFPVVASWRGDWDGDLHDLDLTFTATFGFRGLGDGWERFDAKRYLARPGFLIAKLDLGQTVELPAAFQFSNRISGQWAGNPLISNEQFSLGGMTSVRGYFESEALGDWGAASQTELRTPDLADALGGMLDTLRFHAFYDVGLAGIHQPLPGQDDRFRAMSVGAGANVRILKILGAAVDVGTPLVTTSESRSGDIFARFRIWGEF